MTTPSAVLLALLVAGNASRVFAENPPRAPGAVVAQAEAMVSGRVVDEDGNPLAGVRIVAETPSDDQLLRFETESRADGTFTIPGLMQHVRYKITVEKDGLVSAQRTVTFDRAATGVDFTLRYSGREVAQAAYQRGVAAYQSGDLDEAALAMAEAVAAIETTVAGDDMLVAALVALGQVQLRRGRLDEAGAAYERVVELAPDQVAAHYGLGHVRDGQGDYEAAAAQFQRVIDLQPGYAEAHYSLGSLLITAGELERAVATLEEAVRLRPDLSAAHRSLGSAYARTGDRGKAILHLNMYLEQMPDAPDEEQVRALIEQLKGGVSLPPVDSWRNP